MNREEKQQQITELREAFDGASAAYLTGFSGLTVEALSQLRGDLREAGVGYRVVKNTLAKRALVGSPFEELSPLFEGPTAVAFAGEDPVAPAKVLKNFMKTNEIMTFKGGLLDGGVVKSEELDRVAALPGRDELRSMFLRVLMGVPRGVVTVMNEVPASFLRVLTARGEKLEDGGEVAA